MRYLLILISLVIIASSCTSHDAGTTTTIILLRHAEKDTTQPNTPLSEAGLKRAERLRDKFAHLQPDLLYSTATLRTMQTLQPIATRLNKQILRYDAKAQATLADSLRELEGKTIMIVGHSNTIPYMVNELMREKVHIDIPDSVYGRLYIVTLTEEKPSLTIKNY